ncbi:hypothetical protein OIU34_21475 [Pararhizobium sp. BT-229]|uniref:hypothetical protein n=1 Tax=Pararhizobium sp. BT-229 TaxID=2986923 RepID=UPI0021F7774D|nr:hypothetical protein [Pararhizobium sp. BT-229]MCV9964464.1 hypothetical protein [Pararhizobium sp. BT-229]
MAGAISFIDAFSSLSIRDRARERHLALITDKVCERVFSTAAEGFFERAMGRGFADARQLAGWLADPGSRLRLRSGIFDGRSFVLNTALGNEFLRVLARIEGGCDRGTFVGRGHRGWFAGVLRRAMAAGVIEADSGYRNLPILVETGTEGDLVIASASSGLSFPAHADDIAAMRAEGDTGLSPEGWDGFRFPPLALPG